jgi:hypothetical membrane protein
MRLGLIAYALFIPILGITLATSKTKHKGYSISSFWVSNLGEKGSPNHRWFNINVSTFGFLAFFFVMAFKSLLPNILLSTIGIYFLYLTCLSTILVGLFPMDTKPKAHFLTSILIFTGITGSALFTIYPIYLSTQIPKWTIILNLFILLSFPLLVLSKHIESRKTKTSNRMGIFITTHKGFWEWTSCLSAISWDFIMTLLTLYVLS